MAFLESVCIWTAPVWGCMEEKNKIRKINEPLVCALLEGKYVGYVFRFRLSGPFQTRS